MPMLLSISFMLADRGIHAVHVDPYMCACADAAGETRQSPRHIVTRVTMGESNTTAGRGEPKLV